MSLLTDRIDRAKQTHTRLVMHQPPKLRDRVKMLDIPGRAGLLVGPRGTGKTTWLIRHCDEHHLLYVSADHPMIADVPLYDLLEAAFNLGYEGAVIDEVHHSVDWSKHLKAAYDSFPNKRLIASDSSAVVIRAGTADLSRRFPIHTLPLLSFREYLMLRQDCSVPVIDPFDFNLADVQAILRDLNVMRYFQDYLKAGFRPFFLESEQLYIDKVMNVLTKSMEGDIPFLVSRLTESHLRLMNSVIGYLATSSVPTIQINSLCSEWHIGKETLYELLEAMQRAHLIRIVRKQNDHKVHSVGAKMFLHEPSVYKNFSNNPGTMREAYVAAAFIEAGKTVYAAVKEVDSDFMVDGYQLEVGGSKKKRKSAAYVIRDDTDVPYGQSLPMWLLGFQY